DSPLQREAVKVSHHHRQGAGREDVQAVTKKQIVLGEVQLASRMAQVVVIEKVRDLIAISSRGGRHGVGSARHQTDIGRVTWIGAFKNKLIDDEARREQKSRSRQPWK